MGDYFISADSEETDPALVEAKYQVGRSIFYEASLTTRQYADNTLGAMQDNSVNPNIVTALGLEAPRTQIKISSIPTVFLGSGYFPDANGNPVGCPEEKEWVWIDNLKRVRAKSLIGRKCSLYNPITRNYNRLVKAELLENQPLFKLKTKKGIENIVSHSDKVITRVYDKVGKMLNTYQEGRILSVMEQNIYNDEFSVDDAGFGNVVVISLATEFIYASGSSKKRATIRHNRKDESFSESYKSE